MHMRVRGDSLEPPAMKPTLQWQLFGLCTGVGGARSHPAPSRTALPATPGRRNPESGTSQVAAGAEVAAAAPRRRERGHPAPGTDGERDRDAAAGSGWGLPLNRSHGARAAPHGQDGRGEEARPGGLPGAAAAERGPCAPRARAAPYPPPPPPSLAGLARRRSLPPHLRDVIFARGTGGWRCARPPPSTAASHMRGSPRRGPRPTGALKGA